MAWARLRLRPPRCRPALGALGALGAGGRRSPWLAGLLLSICWGASSLSFVGLWSSSAPGTGAPAAISVDAPLHGTPWQRPPQKPSVQHIALNSEAQGLARRLVQRRAADKDSEREGDILAGEDFSRRAKVTFDVERPAIQVILFVSGFVAVSGAIALFYNALGVAALLSTPGAKPGLDTFQAVLVQALAVVGGALAFSTVNAGRTNALRVLDREFSFGQLEFEIMDGMGVTKRLAEAKGKRRVLALIGEGPALETALREASAYRRRWATSETVVVAVADQLPPGLGGKWLGRARSPEVWRFCYEAWTDAATSGAANTEEQVVAGGGSATWLLFGRSGRIRGAGPAQNWDEVLGFIGVEENLSQLPSLAPRSSGGEEEESRLVKEVLEVHDTFYKALIDGDIGTMRPLWELPDDQAEDPMRKRRVPWESVLSDKAAVLAVVDVDVVFTGSDRSEAMVTSIEVCEGAPGFLNEGGPDGKGSLLATKRFRRHSDSQGASSWRLVSHQTIPYCRNTLATQSLRCNSSGCLLLKPTG